MNVLLGVGQKDYTNKIVEGSYKVYKNDVTYDWTDGNNKEHRDLLRTRTEGSFSMSFKTWSEFTTFLNDMGAVKSGTEYTLTVFAINTNTAVTSSFFLDIPNEYRQKNDLTFTPGTFTVKIREA